MLLLCASIAYSAARRSGWHRVIALACGDQCARPGECLVGVHVFLQRQRLQVREWQFDAIGARGARRQQAEEERAGIQACQGAQPAGTAATQPHM